MEFIFLKQSQIRRKLIIFFCFSSTLSLPSVEYIHKMTGFYPCCSYRIYTPIFFSMAVTQKKSRKQDTDSLVFETTMVDISKLISFGNLLVREVMIYAPNYVRTFVIFFTMYLLIYKCIFVCIALLWMVIVYIVCLSIMNHHKLWKQHI